MRLFAGSKRDRARERERGRGNSELDVPVPNSVGHGFIYRVRSDRRVS